jgi:hypothetical protein
MSEAQKLKNENSLRAVLIDLFASHPCNSAAEVFLPHRRKAVKIPILQCPGNVMPQLVDDHHIENGPENEPPWAVSG